MQSWPMRDVSRWESPLPWTRFLATQHGHTNRTRRVLWGVIVCLTACLITSPVSAEEALEIGERRELFVDDYLLAKLSGGVRQEVQLPRPAEVVLVTDQPWEGNTCAYYAIFQDGERYRMYYRGSHFNTETKKGAHPEVTCYAESTDGINWQKPNLGLYEFAGSKENNIVWDGLGTHCFTPFLDTRPDCPPKEKYKAVSAGKRGDKRGLFAFRSADGIHWELWSEEPIITKGAFDSQNLAFYDAHTGQYRCYHRTFRGVRDIQWQVSDDFLSWTQPVFLNYNEGPLEHLYTNAILMDPRVPHLYLGFPTRFLPDEGQRVEPTFMASRDGSTFYRWREPIVPESAPEDRDGNRSNYMAWGLLDLPGKPQEYSVYATEAYYTGPDSRLRRFVYRKDGYVALAAEESGTAETKPLKLRGNQLLINAACKPQGSVKVELKTADGHSWVSRPFQGDAIDQPLQWEETPDWASLQDQAATLCFHLHNAHLYSFQCQQQK